MQVEGQTMQWPKEKLQKTQTLLYKILCRKQKTERHESH